MPFADVQGTGAYAPIVWWQIKATPVMRFEPIFSKSTFGTLLLGAAMRNTEDHSIKLTSANETLSNGSSTVSSNFVALLLAMTNVLLTFPR